MLPNEVEAIIGGYHGDPFRVLGPHQTAEGWEGRAFIPQAMAASVVATGMVHPMRKLRHEGFFQANLPCDRGRYQLGPPLWTGAGPERDDASRFPPLLTDFELHL